MRIGIVVGEESGDILGAGLIRALKNRLPSVETVGIGGERMLAEGFQSLFPQERLAVMGFVEPLKRLPELLRIRRSLLRYFLQFPVDIFVGIDSPDFNLTLERQLKKAGTKTVHYVSPSVWAWRQGRIKKIAAAVDLVLTLFPFEARFYRQHNVPVDFVGHPLADRLPFNPDKSGTKAWLLKQTSIQAENPIIALLPGSRSGEVKLLGPIFWQFARQLSTVRPNVQFVVAAANALRKDQIEQQLMDSSISSSITPQVRPTIIVIEGQSHQVMAAADVVVMASGTTTLEAMLLKKPMVVAYKMAPISAWIISRLLKSKYVALPNLLANRNLVPELLQSQVTPENIVTEVLGFLDNPERVAALYDYFYDIHCQLKCGANERAVASILKLL
jgi:lipid-A-disaccharide synthase